MGKAMAALSKVTTHFRVAFAYRMPIIVTHLTVQLVSDCVRDWAEAVLQDGPSPELHEVAIELVGVRCVAHGQHLSSEVDEPHSGAQNWPLVGRRRGPSAPNLDDLGGRERVGFSCRAGG